jgi:hypothetical protein
MALKKQKQYKGLTTEYNAIIATGYLKTTNKTSVSLGAYVSKEARDLDVNNFILELTESFIFDGELTREEIYPLIKQSKPKIVTPMIPAVLDEEGNVITPEVPAIVEETNPWASSEDY